ncbi:MAG: TonB-dependent receptor, partial [Gemmatimonadetes bacterium]|nr:TonB-dependent receptor [Gemmatimonadota bacterium]
MIKSTFRASMVLVAVLMMGFVGSVAAQETRTVQGLVQDSTTGETLPYAVISVAGTTLRTVSNRDGFFVLVGAPVGPFVIRVASVGFTVRNVEVGQELSADRIVVDMAPIPFELEAITVVADDYRIMRATEGVSRVTVSPRDMAILPSIGEVDIFRSLQLLPGISGTNESSSGLYVRGGTPDQNLVLLDGMTVYHVDHFFGFFSAFNADAIKDVQVYKGGFPALYGGRVSSVVDMTGKTGDPYRAHVSMGANLLSAQTSAQVPLFGKGSIMFSARRSYTDVLQTGLYNSIFNMFNGEDEAIGVGTTAAPRQAGGRFGGRFGQDANVSTTSPDFYFYDINGKATYRPSGSDVLSLSVYNGQDYLDKSRLQNQTLATQGTQPTRAVNNDITDLTDWGNKGISGKWARQWGARLYSNALVAFSEYFSDYGRRTAIEVRDADADSVLQSRNFGSSENNRVTDL